MENFLESLYKILKRITSKSTATENDLLQRTDPTPLLKILKLFFNDRIFAIFEKDPDSFPMFSKLTEEIIKVCFKIIDLILIKKQFLG